MVGIIMGSTSDLPVMQEAANVLEETPFMSLFVRVPFLSRKL